MMLLRSKRFSVRNDVDLLLLQESRKSSLWPLAVVLQQQQSRFEQRPYVGLSVCPGWCKRANQR